MATILSPLYTMLSFNDKILDFWKVYESIKRFYPIGIRKDESGLFYSYPGLKELENIIVDNMHDESNLQTRWADFTSEIKHQVGKEIIGTTYGQAPAFSSFVLLEKATLPNLTRTKELHFFVSLIGPYYTVIGQDSNMVKMEGTSFLSTNYLVVSPENEFADVFRLVCEEIENRFEGYRFIPFEYCCQTIDGLQVRYTHENLNAVFHALFNNQVDITTQNYIGNRFYKSEDWIKEGWVNPGGEWAIYPPIEYPSAAANIMLIKNYIKVTECCYLNVA